MRIVWGLLGIALGIFILAKTFSLVNFFGKIDWAERHLSGGFGGTYFLYKLIGLAVIFFSALYMFGLIDAFIHPLSGVFGGIGGQ